MSWVDILVPAQLQDNPVLAGLDAVDFVDESNHVRAGALDLASLSLVYQMLIRPSLNLAIQLPRGDHDFAIFCGLFVQLTRLIAKARPAAFPAEAAFAGPVVVIGMNTMVQERLRSIRIGNVSLAEGLTACRIRSDGRVVDPSRGIGRLRPDDGRILYVNTRAGWPQLDDLRFIGVAIIDRTSFANPDILERALAWSEGHHARKILVISDLGEDETRRVLGKSNRRYAIWPWARPLTEQLVYECGKAESKSRLSTNPLLSQESEGVKVAVCQAPAIDEGFRAAFSSLAAAARVEASPPGPLVTARRLFFALSRCVGTLDSLNEWAALDHRSRSLKSLRLELEDASLSSFAGPWSPYGATRWAELRYELLRLYDLIHAENPKLYALAFTLERLRADRDCETIIRLPSEAAGYALASDLADLGLDIEGEEGSPLWASFGVRRPWAVGPLIEIYPGWLPMSRLAALWSGESSLRLHLCYPFEQGLLDISLSWGRRIQRETLEAAFLSCGLGVAPSLIWNGSAGVEFSFEPDRRPGSGKRVVELTMDSDLLVIELPEPDEDAVVGSTGEEGYYGADAWARPITLEPGDEIWWAREGTEVEVLTEGRHSWRRLSLLGDGDEVIVPRGEGRDELFGRLVAATHSRDDLQAFEVFFRRWRAACWKVYEDSGRNWCTVAARMREEGSRVGWQAFRNWAEGRTIAPEDAQDIARIGKVAVDQFIEQQARRLDAIARQVRGFHIKLGHLLSSAMTEARAGGGANLDALGKLLGNVDAVELLDEFEIRIVRDVGAPEEVRLSQVGRVHRMPVVRTLS
jgi:hypothetical protein